MMMVGVDGWVKLVVHQEEGRRCVDQYPCHPQQLTPPPLQNPPDPLLTLQGVIVSQQESAPVSDPAPPQKRVCLDCGQVLTPETQ